MNQSPGRLLSLDAYRGFVMLAMASNGLNLPKVSEHFPGSRLWGFLAYEADHSRWIGCSFWDLIMPSFIFMVGVALPYSVAGRRAKGEAWPQMLAHTVYRSIVLVALGIFLWSDGAKRTVWTFIPVLCQIGLGYTFALLLVGRGPRVQLGAIAAILFGYWLWFYFYPAPPADFDFTTVGGPRDWPRMTGIAAHWDLNTNAAAAFDRWFLNLFPRETPFKFREGGGATLNFVPSIATMTLGVRTGEMLRSGRPAGEKMKWLLLSGAACLGLGVGLDPSILHAPFSSDSGSTALTLCPIVKRMWTPSWALFSAGWVLWTLAAFYAIIDVRGLRRWSFPLVVVGTNSIAMYVMAALMPPWIHRTLRTHLGNALFDGTYGPAREALGVLILLWLICFWMYRRKIFLKI